MDDRTPTTHARSCAAWLPGWRRSCIGRPIQGPPPVGVKPPRPELAGCRRRPYGWRGRRDRDEHGEDARCCCGAMTGLLMLVGELLGGRGGMTMALCMAGVMNFVAFFWSDKIVLRMYHAQPVDARAEAPGLYADRAAPGPQGQASPCRAVRDPRPGAQRLRHGPQPAATPRWRSPRGCCHAMDPRGAGGRARPRAVARAQPGHADLDGGGHAGGRHHDAGADGHVLGRRARTTAAAAAAACWWR